MHEEATNKMRTTAKRLLSVFLSLFMLFSIPISNPTTVYAESVSANLTITYISGYRFNYSGLGLDCGSYNGQASILKANGRVAYCVELGATAKQGSYTFSESYDKLSDRQQLLIRFAMMYGYDGDTHYGYNDNAEYWATQIVIWIIQNGYFDDSNMASKIMEGSMTQCPDKSAIRDIVSKIMEQIAEHTQRPSFTSSTSTDAPTHELNLDSNGKYSITLTDSNGVVDYFSWKGLTNNGISVDINNNQVTFTSNEPIIEAKLFGLKKESGKYIDVHDVSPLYLSSSSIQDMVCDLGTHTDPITAYMALKTSLGHINIVKRAEDGKASGLKFRIQGDGVDQTVTTGSGGTVLVENLVPGDYTVTEVDTPSRYVQPKSQTLKVESGKTTQFSFSNVLKKVQMNVTKTDKETGTVKTGDRNPLVIIAMILASVRAAGVGYYLYKRRKELREQENLE